LFIREVLKITIFWEYRNLKNIPTFTKQERFCFLKPTAMIKKYILWVFIYTLSGSLSLFSQGQFNVLVYTSPDYYHNPVLPTAISEFRKMAEKHFFKLEWSQQASIFNEETLKDYSVIVFLHANGASLNEEQMSSLKQFVRQGGGFVGIHATSVTQEQDEWFQKLVGRVFIRHPEKQTAVINVIDRNFPACMHLPDHWLWTDEWYEFGEALTDSMHMLLSVDETTYNAINRMGGLHPVSWYQEWDGGRSFYTAMGHLEIHYTDARFLDHIYGGIYWAATGRGVLKNTSGQF
jgi:type 1 glutamine amidotransferase